MIRIRFTVSVALGLLASAALASAVPTPRAAATPIAAPSAVSPPGVSPQAIADLDARVRALETRVTESVANISKLSESTVSNVDMYAKYLTYGLALLAGLAALLGFREFSDFKKQTKATRAYAKRIVDRVQREAEETLAKAKGTAALAESRIIMAERDLAESTALSRAIPMLMRGEIRVLDQKLDAATRKQILEIHAQGALRHLQDAIDKGIATPPLMNWKAFALKRLGKIEDAYAAAKAAYGDGDATPYERVRAAYNMACYLSILSDLSKSFEYLKQTIEMDRRYALLVPNEDDLANLKRARNAEVEELLRGH